jgi:hypothetical protein
VDVAKMLEKCDHSPVIKSKLDPNVKIPWNKTHKNDKNAPKMKRIRSNLLGV